jgi:microcystin-dependent protein
MPQPFVGEIRIFAGSFAPTGWALCDGQLMPISQNTALFSLLGTAYGGDGRSTFALPDLRGRVPVHVGQGPGLTERLWGEVLGSEAHTLSVGEIPVHTHPLGASAANGSSDAPAGGVMARSPAAVPQYAAVADTTLAASAVSPTGGGQPHNNMQPYLTLNFIIALQGFFPSRWP